MNDVFYYIDNDVIFKLSQYDLLDEFIQAYETSFESIFILSTLKYRAYLKEEERSIEFLGSKEAYDNVVSIVGSCKEAVISDELMKEVIQSDQLNIDHGELILTYCLKETEESKLVTGDKRAVKALSEHSEFNFCRCKVLILEQILLKMINTLDFGTIRKKISSNPDVDKALRVCFSSKKLEGVALGLNSYIGDLSSFNESVEAFLSH
jgi:hypothetical protein